MRLRLRAWHAGILAFVLGGAGATVGLLTNRFELPRFDGADRGAAGLAEAEARNLLAYLLTGVYTAYEQEDEEAIYDRLSAVAATELVADLYLEKRRLQLLREDDGAEVRFRSVQIDHLTATSLPNRPGYELAATWRASGAIRHATHVHERVNQYAAGLTMVELDGVWKLEKFDLKRIERLVDDLPAEEVEDPAAPAAANLPAVGAPTE